MIYRYISHMPVTGSSALIVTLTLDKCDLPELHMTAMLWRVFSEAEYP